MSWSVSTSSSSSSGIVFSDVCHIGWLPTKDSADAVAPTAASAGMAAKEARAASPPELPAAPTMVVAEGREAPVEMFWAKEWA